MTTTRETADHAELAACPFCGGTATIERFGNTRVSTQYQCDDCGCFLETGEEFHHGRWWNRRPREEALLSEIAALRGLLDERDLEIAEDDAAMRDLDAQIEDANDRATQAERQRDELRDIGMSIYVYANDTLSGRIDGPDDREWQRACVVEVRNRARAFLANQGADQCPE